MSAKEILGSDHAELDKLLADVLWAFHESDHDTIFTKLDYFWARLAMHIRAEHLHLFSSLLKARGQTCEAVEMIRSLREDHDFFMRELADAVKVLRKSIGDGKAGDMSLASKKNEAVAARLKRHNTMEEQHIYTCVEELVGDAECLEAAVKLELDKLPRRFVKY